jgi:hypothetical protein
MRPKQLVFGMASFIPGVRRLGGRGTGGTNSARYCYSVWLRHLVMASRSGLDTCPRVVAELGPGDSLGTGLAALLSGCDEYYGFDVVEHASSAGNVAIFEQLVELFKNRTPIPGRDEFPFVKPYLDDYAFPAHILDEERMDRCLEGSRIEKIRASLASLGQEESLIRYVVPWSTSDVFKTDPVNMIFSQAVLQFLDALPGTYRAMHSWLTPGGYISHQIDYTCGGTAKEWNGHWRYSDLEWRILRGRRAYYINREPNSAHLAAAKDAGFTVVRDQTITSASYYAAHQMAGRFRSLSEDDLVTSGTFMQAVKET